MSMIFIPEWMFALMVILIFAFFIAFITMAGIYFDRKVK